MNSGNLCCHDAAQAASKKLVINMKSAKYLLAFLAVLFFSLTGFSQSNNGPKEQAEARVAEINDAIVSVNPALALSDAQKKKITDLHIARTEKITAAKKSDKAEHEKNDAVNEAIKAFNLAVNNDVLTKEQAKAKREAAANKKG